ncbi:MAG: CinA family protein [Gammaproteobacteria bacterium]|nr:CinA family protein [Gammaproteobacteria bacterium]
MSNINYSLSWKLGQTLLQSGLKIATAESCTGGGIAEEITAVNGSSRWFDCGFIAYANEAKIQALGVAPDILMNSGAVSEETALAMAAGALANSRADIAISVTGVAGPSGGSEEKPVGLVWFACARRGEEAVAKSAQFAGGRKNVRCSAIRFALNFVLSELKVSALSC